MAPGQDWCLQCGAGAPGSISDSGWRPAVTVLAATIVLLLAAAAAGYAALSKKPRHAALVTATVAQTTPAPAPGVPTPPAGGPTATTPPAALAKPPSIPLKTVTPPPAATTPTTPTTTTGGGTQTTPTTGSGGSEPSAPEPILLDTNAAETYNPYNYPATAFGDPSLSIDGDSSTGWTAQVNPATAPGMAEGVLINLRAGRKLSAVKITTTTPGMTVQVYGANGHAAPASITDPAWTALSRAVVLKKRHARIGLRKPKQSYTYVALWISKAPASAVGTPEAPGKVSINELELFPAG
jgi:hypothetical protein